jgi:energy-coupling factor transport system ATP-binding protein
VDEPTTGQDPEMSLDIFEIIKKLNRAGTTVIAITHNVDLAALYARRAVVLNRGRVSFDGDIQDLLLDEDLMRANSLELPHITKLAKSLSNYGIPPNTVRYDEMKEFLREILEVRSGH